MAGGGSNAGGSGGFDPGGGGSTTVPQYAELWYQVEDRLVHFPLDPTDGSAQPYQQSLITNPPPVGYGLLTMLNDGSLLIGRLSTGENRTYLYHLPDPPRDGSPVALVELGMMIDNLMIEGLYTDCDGRLYGMDTGADVTSSTGNRLIRFTGDVLQSDFSYAVVSDLSTAVVADIDDMGPGIDQGQITDNPGLAIDSGDVYAFDFESGTGSLVGSGGTYGIHALGGSLFDDAVARLYLLSLDAELLEMDPTSYAVSPPLAVGPADLSDPLRLGWSGLAGPLTHCDSGFTPPR